MQTYLPLINAQFSEWYLFTISNPLYAAALAIAVWLLTAMLYSIRIAALKKGSITNEKTNLEKLNVLQQQLQDSQEELISATGKMDKAQIVAQDETKRAMVLEQLIYQRNQQIAEIIQTLASSFDLGERPLLASEDVKADLLWQQLNKVITLLTERLRSELQAKTELQKTYQAETAKLAEKEVLLKALQTTIDHHSNQLSKLEHLLEEQKLLLQQQNNTQLVLSNTMEKYYAELSRPTEIKIEPTPKQETIEQVIVIQQPLFEEHQQAVTQPELDFKNEQIEVINEPADEPIIAEQIEITATELPQEDALNIEADQDDIAAPIISDNIPEPITPPKGSFGKIKNLFGKSKPKPIKTEPQWTEKVEAEPLQTENDKAPEKGPGKLKGFYNKFKNKP